MTNVEKKKTISECPTYIILSAFWKIGRSNTQIITVSVSCRHKACNLPSTYLVNFKSSDVTEMLQADDPTESSTVSRDPGAVKLYTLVLNRFSAAVSDG